MTLETGAAAKLIRQGASTRTRPIDLVKVFSATMFADRAVIGERATEWLREQLVTHEISECIVTQSSDSQFHCIALTFFMRRRSP